jgi:hypothetical protein
MRRLCGRSRGFTPVRFSARGGSQNLSSTSTTPRATPRMNCQGSPTRSARRCCSTTRCCRRPCCCRTARGFRTISPATSCAKRAARFADRSSGRKSTASTERTRRIAPTPHPNATTRSKRCSRTGRTGSACSWCIRARASSSSMNACCTRSLARRSPTRARHRRREACAIRASCIRSSSTSIRSATSCDRRPSATGGAIAIPIWPPPTS